MSLFTNRVRVAAIFTTMLTATASAETLNLGSVALRTADADGLGTFVGGVITASSFELPSIVRPNGQSNWNTSESGYAGLFNVNFGSGVAESELESWMQSNFSGMWDVTWSGQQTASLNVAPYYQSISNRGYLQLTAASAMLFENIRANGLTGSFTFDLAQPGSPIDQRDAYIIGDPNTFVSISGTSFTMNISNALSSNAQLILSNSSTFDNIGFGMGLHSATIRTVSDTVYGLNIVPAPGAMALLGLAGLAGRRRR